MTTEQVVQQNVEALKQYYESKGQLKGYISEFRMARNITDEKLAALPSRFIPKLCKALDEAGVPTIDARKIVEADARGLGWTQRAVIASLPKHYKNPKLVEYGSLGGKEVARRRGLAAASQETRDRVATSGGEARAEDIKGLSKAGTKGGNAVLEKYGTGYFSEIGSKAHNEEEPQEIEQLFTGEIQINPLEWLERIFATMEEGRTIGRNVVLVLNDSKLVTIRLAGVPFKTDETS